MGEARALEDRSWRWLWWFGGFLMASLLIMGLAAVYSPFWWAVGACFALAVACGARSIVLQFRSDRLRPAPGQRPARPS